jgi:hypothetical protein
VVFRPWGGPGQSLGLDRLRQGEGTVMLAEVVTFRRRTSLGLGSSSGNPLSFDDRMKTKVVMIGCSVLALPSLLLLLCGLFVVQTLVSSGTWHDDPGNWRRVFGSQRPESVEVLRSHYWKSSHWTYEAAYCFKLRVTDECLKTMKQGLRQRESNIVDYRYWMDAPDWFPKNGTEVDEIWYDDSEPEGFNHSIMILDTNNQVVYLADWQV